MFQSTLLSIKKSIAYPEGMHIMAAVAVHGVFVSNKDVESEIASESERFSAKQKDRLRAFVKVYEGLKALDECLLVAFDELIKDAPENINDGRYIGLYLAAQLDETKEIFFNNSMRAAVAQAERENFTPKEALKMCEDLDFANTVIGYRCVRDSVIRELKEGETSPDRAHDLYIILGKTESKGDELFERLLTLMK